MNKMTVWLIVAAALVIVGLTVFVIEMTALGWDFSRLSTVRYESVTHGVEQPFHSISVDTKTADITFALAEDGVGRVVADETEKLTYSVSVEDGTLKIGLVDEREWHDRIGLFFVTPKLTVYLPQKEYEALTIQASTGDVQIPKNFIFERLTVEISTGDVTLGADVNGQTRVKTSTGDILVENMTTGALDLRATTGDITVKNVNCVRNMDLSATTGRVSVMGIWCVGNIDVSIGTGETELSDFRCKNLTTVGTTGDLCMKNVTANESFSIERTTGDVTFDACDAAEITVRTTTGDVKGSLLSSKMFAVNATTGDVDVPPSSGDGKCEITTSTGDIQIEIVAIQPD